MDLLRTILVYMTMVFTASVQSTPMPSDIPAYDAPTQTPYVETATDAPTQTPAAQRTPVPTVAITPNPEYGVIRVGDSGDDVLEMQKKLAEYGYYTGELDGRFGNQTRAAVEAFQYQHGLSVDGVAGRNTLTVLYESDEVRPAPGAATPEPSTTPDATTRLTAAITLSPSPSPAPQTPQPATQAPSETPSATTIASPTPSPTPTATTTPEFLPVTGASITLQGEDEPLTLHIDGEDEPFVIMPYTYGDALYLPLFEVLSAARINVIFTSSVEAEEYAFAMGNDVVRISFGATQSGEPDGLEAYVNNEPQVLPQRDIRLADGLLYLTEDTIQRLTGITAQRVGDDVVVLLPEEPQA